MEMSKSVQMKLTFGVLTLLFVIAFSGAASAMAVIDEETTAPLVTETGEKFYGTTAIQDAIDDADTANGYHVQIQPGAYLTQLTVTKDLTLSGVDTDPHETVIAHDSQEGVITIPTEVSVVLENMAILTQDQGVNPINNNGQLILINCLVNGVYYEYGVFGSVEILETQTMETMTLNNPEQTFISESKLIGEITTDITNTEGTTETSVTETSSTSNTETDTTKDPGIPLASLASGMLMVMGGTVVSGRKHP